MPPLTERASSVADKPVPVSGKAGIANAFTPGPWHPIESPALSVVADEQHPVICHITAISDRDEDAPEIIANARLISASPEGFELIEELEESFTADGAYQQFLPAMRAYLAKVRGEQSK